MTNGEGLAGGAEEPVHPDSFEPSDAFRARALVRDRTEHRRASENPESWWAEQADQLDWFRRWNTVLDAADPPFFKWFVGGRINASYNCLDRHVAAGAGDRVAFHWRGENGEERDVTYADLLRDTQRFANALRAHGIRKGDVVGIFLPMIPEVAVAMLACARIGAIHNVVFGGFSPASVKERMEFSHAKALVTVDGARRKGVTTPVKAQVDASGLRVQTTFVVRHTGSEAQMTDGDVWYHEALAEASDVCPPEELSAEDPLFILYTSGSTNTPKGVLHSTGGYLTGVAWTARHVFDLRPEEDIWWCSADVGWITGHSYVVYGPLLNGVTSVMWEGGPDYPSRDVWWRLIERYRVTVFYTAPTAIRSCMKWGEEHPASHDLSSLRLLGTVGEPINPKAWMWYHDVIGGGRCPIVDTWWQTETGAILITTLPGAEGSKPGVAGRPLPGISARVVDETGGDVEPGQQGLLVLDRPWPSMLRTLHGEDERFVETYFSRLGTDTYVVGDAARIDDDGYISIVGRIDDVINVSGHRMSTAEIESAIVSHPLVAEAAVVGEADEDTGQAVAAFVTLVGERSGDGELEEDIRQHVARRIGKLARPKRIVWAEELPKTRSGKIMRRLLRDIIEDRAPGDVSTLRDPSVPAALAAQVAAARSAPARRGHLSVAFLGTGIMGSAMARNAAAAGFDVRAWSRPLDDARHLEAAGITVADSAAAAAAGADLVVTMVPDVEAIESFADGPEGFLPALDDKAIWIQSSTVGVEATDRLSLLAARHEVVLVDVPVLGSRQPAERGELVMLASGPGEALDRCEPLFAVIARKVLRLGPVGMGSRMKLATNNWIMSTVAALGETMALAEAFGLDGRDFLAAIAGTPMDMGYAQLKGTMIADGVYTPNMRLAHGAKDARLALTAARKLGLPARVTAATAALMADGCDLGHADDDMAAAFFAALPMRRRT